MRFPSDQLERRFITEANASSIWIDKYYSLYMLGFCILALKRQIAALPDTEFAILLTAVGFLWLPLMYFLWTFCRSWYARHRQPIVFIRKAAAVAISTTYASNFYDNMHGSSTAAGATSPGLSLFMSSLGIASQLLTHAMGFPNYGNWQLVSQAVGTVMAFRTSAIMCKGELAITLGHVATSLPSHSLFSDLKASVFADPQLACCIYCIWLHTTVGFIIATVISNILEFQQRRRFYARRFPNRRRPLTLSDLHHKEWFNVLLIIIMYVIMEGLTVAVNMAFLGAAAAQKNH